MLSVTTVARDRGGGGRGRVSNSRSALRRFSDPRRIRDLHEEWSALHDASGSTNPFSGPEWPTLWFERFLQPGDESWLLEVRDDERLVAVVPLYRRASRAVGPALLQS